MGAVPEIRIRQCNEAPLRASGKYVLYWMIAARRVRYNFALDRAIERCREFSKPLLVFEGLRCGYPWASDRLHAFVLQGMADNQRACESAGVTYFPYVEAAPGDGRGLLEALAAGACAVITDEFPCFFLPAMVEAAARKLSVRLESVDSNGLLPLRAASRAYPTAYAFRRILQNALPSHLCEVPAADPLQARSLPRLARLPPGTVSRWPAASRELLEASSHALASLAIDHRVAPAQIMGGCAAAKQHLASFLRLKLRNYQETRNEPELDASSGLSPYLHFGHISAHEIFAELARQEEWSPRKISLRNKGSREGWWNMSAGAEAFLDQLITWRELGYNFCTKRRDYDHYDSLPAWAQETLEVHSADDRQYVYARERFERAATHDSMWNAAQMQLVKEGRIHNYLRMLWGKKILEWSRTPKKALETMTHLNNKYALDGRDPNSYSGIFWCLGRYDRPWGPERPIFGKVRYMSSENTARKVSMKNYIRKYGSSEESNLIPSRP